MRSSPVEVVGGRPERNVDDAAPRVDGHLAPVVDAADVFPGILRPGVVAELTGPRHRVERPHQPASDARRTHGCLQAATCSLRRSRCRQSPGFRRPRPGCSTGCCRCCPAARPSRPTRRSTTPLVPNDITDLPVARVDLLQQAVHREDQPLIAAVGTLPVIHAAAGHRGHVFAHPPFAAGGRRRRPRVTRCVRGRK